MWSPHPSGPHIVPMLSPCCPHVVSTSQWSPHCPHIVSTVSPCGLNIPVVPMLSTHCPHVVPMLSPLTHLLTHPSIQLPIQPTVGWGVSTNHKSSNRIELSQLGQDSFDF